MKMIITILAGIGFFVIADFIIRGIIWCFEYVNLRKKYLRLKHQTQLEEKKLEEYVKEQEKLKTIISQLNKEMKEIDYHNKNMEE
jgi:predicted nuclease with TOPRIM domain